MLSDGWAIVLNLVSIQLLGLLAATTLLALLFGFLQDQISTLSARSQKTALWLFVLSPWLISVICAITCFPSLFQTSSSGMLSWLTHWHSPYEFHLGSWHSLKLLLFTIVVVYFVLRKLWQAVRHIHALDTLAGLSSQQSSQSIGDDVVILQAPQPLAFASGLLKPKCFLTSGLIQQLTEQELAIVIAHERAHICHKDGIKKWLFTLLAALYPAGITQQLQSQFSMATELLADARVSRRFSPFDVAQTLIKAARLQRRYGLDIAASANTFVANDVDQRVRALIIPSAGRAFPWLPSLALLLLTTLFCSVAVDVLHHFIELFLTH
ncbi:MAG: M56 family metallopeptidase [Rickettsiales bacterium]